MGAKSRAHRMKFNADCLRRDNDTCVVCGARSNGNVDVPLEIHHITPRKEMPNGGYVKENGITVCGPCHYGLEMGRLSAAAQYKLIKSSYEQALDASSRLC